MPEPHASTACSLRMCEFTLPNEELKNTVRFRNCIQPVLGYYNEDEHKEDGNSDTTTTTTAKGNRYKMHIFDDCMYGYVCAIWGEGGCIAFIM